MKPPMLGLTVATVVFGTTSLYLWQQLSVERERAAQVAPTTLKLNARIAELENARTQFAQLRNASAGSYRLENSGPAAVGGGPPPAAAAEPNVEASEQLNPWSGPRREPPAAFKKVMRSQMRASNKELYSDVGDALGLSKGTADKLVDLITDLETPLFDQLAGATDPAEAQRVFEEARRKREADIADLIGPEKLQALQEYQKSLPARQEFSMLANQLESNEVALTPEQSKKLLAAFVEERSRVPMPTYTAGMDSTEYGKSVASWQDEFNRRIGDEASQILNPEQLATYNEIQQWEKELREQYTTVASSGAGPRLVQRGGPAFNAVTVNGAAVSFTSATVQMPAPSPGSKSAGSSR